jgi:hypothetical protein
MKALDKSLSACKFTEILKENLLLFYKDIGLFNLCIAPLAHNQIILTNFLIKSSVVFPGSFNPYHAGHQQIADRALQLS